MSFFILNVLVGGVLHFILPSLIGALENLINL